MTTRRRPRPAPGQMTLADVLDIRRTGTGTLIVVLQGGRVDAPVVRKAAAA